MFYRQRLQCSCLENPRDGGAWWAAVYGVAQSRTQLKHLAAAAAGMRTRLSSSHWADLQLQFVMLMPKGHQQGLVGVQASPTCINIKSDGN